MIPDHCRATTICLNLEIRTKEDQSDRFTDCLYEFVCHVFRQHSLVRILYIRYSCIVVNIRDIFNVSTSVKNTNLLKNVRHIGGCIGNMFTPFYVAGKHVYPGARYFDGYQAEVHQR